MSPLAKRLQLLLSALSVLFLLAAGAAGWFWLQLRGSRPALDGEHAVAGLGTPVRIERDALGVPTITAASRTDAAQALGFLHAQDRFFQMDLLRRGAAGELAGLLGNASVSADRRARVHGFRRVAERSVARLPAAQRAVLDAYTAGANAGLTALSKKPWEYLVLRTDPAPWRAEDSLLVTHAMWLDLQDHRGDFEMTLRALRQSLGEAGLEFLAPRGNSWDAALDGSTFPAAPLPPLRLRRPDDAAALVPAFILPRPDPQFPGSNSFAVAGAHTATGAALLANDMHLDLRVPNTWYRAVLAWSDAAGPHRVAGVTLPGTPPVVAGSNGRIAWGFTNSYMDSSDVILVETDSVAQFQYRTTRGWVEIAERNETIKVRGGDDATALVRSTEWGPIIGGPEDGRYYALRWTAHAPEATDLTLMELETASAAAAAVAIAHRAGMPNQNIAVADTAGNIAWTITGRIPRRHGYDGRLPTSWAYGDRYWDGWLDPPEVPVVLNPAGGILWTANQRPVGGEACAKLGDGGYNSGARARQIRDDLRALVASGRKAVPADLLAVALDDRAVFLERWKDLLLAALSDGAVAGKKPRAALRDAVRQWNGRADPASAAHRLVRAFRLKTTAAVLDPLLARAESDYERFDRNKLFTEDAVWRLIQEKPVRLLNPAHATWEELLLAAADAVLADVEKAGLSPAEYTWGRRNPLRMRHPFSSFLPAFLARQLDMPAEALPGDSNMPRVQAAGHGASERMIVSPGREEEGIFHMPGGQSGHPLSPFYRAGHAAWAKGEPAPFLPGPAAHTLTLKPP